MPFKRDRSTYENQSQPSSYVIYGTAIPATDAESRDDGTFVPVWKQEVTDDRGRKRLHGAFTGGFSAGSISNSHVLFYHTVRLTCMVRSYFNTVGSKEGVHASNCIPQAPSTLKNTFSRMDSFKF